LAWQGHVPYRDFLFHQLPLVLYLYGAVARFVAPSIWAGRAFSVLLTWAAALAALGLAKRLYGMRGALLAGLLMASGSFAMFHLALAKGYAWGALMLAGAMYLVCAPLRRGPAVRRVAAGAMFAGATLVRSTAALALVIATFWEAVARRQVARAALLATTGALVVGGVTVPFALLDWRDMWFGIWIYHQVHWLRFESEFAALQALKHFLPLALLTGAALVSVGLGSGARGLREVFWRSPNTRLLTLVVVPLTLLHIFVGARLAEYHALYYPLACVLVGGWLARAWRVARSVTWRTLQVVLLVVAACIGLFATWAEGTWLDGVHRYPGLPQSLVQVVKAYTAPGDRVLCLHPEVFLATGRDGVPGTEMGLFALLHNYSRDGWRPAGSFTEEDFLRLVQQKAVPLLVSREDDGGLKWHTSYQRTGRTDYGDRLLPTLRAGYQMVLRTPPMENGRREWSYEVWVRK